MISTGQPGNEDEAMRTILRIYSGLGFKPPQKQFTVLASFYLSRSVQDAESSTPSIKVIALSTGTKCTPAIKYSPLGELLHDTHAEVLARRGAVRWFMEEISRMNGSQEYKSSWLAHTNSSGPSESDEHPPYRLRPDVSLQMYISTLPCGDASMGYLASTQDSQMALLKSQSMDLFPKLQAHEASRGRDNYSRLGVLRTKPGRADSSPALSMSCSDKIAKWSVIGILGGFGSRLLEPVYLKRIIVGEFPDSGDQVLRDIAERDCKRALRSRIGKINGLPEGYAVHPPELLFTDLPFGHSKLELDKTTRTTGSCNESLCWVADSRPAEVVINGLRRSTSPKNRYAEKYRALLSRISLFNLYNHTLTLAGLEPVSDDTHYTAAKALSTRYQSAKSALLGPSGPFSGWVRIDARYQEFLLDGSHRTTSLRVP